MSADIGARVGIDGEKAFRDSLGAINSQLKTLGSEMKSVVSSFAGMEDSEEAVTAKSDVLQRSITASKDKIQALQTQSERAKTKLSKLADELENAKREFGDNSEQAIKAQNAYNRQVTSVNKLQTQINNATADMNRMEKEMRDISNAADDMGDDLKQAGEDAGDAGNSFRDAFLGGTLSGMVQSLASSISGLVESTTEYRKIMGTLEVSSERAGYTAEQTTQTYQQLYGVIGDNQQAATATANLQALGLSQEQLTQLTDGAIGAWAKYGDSIPIDGLSEALNETVKAGKVTGNFADVLNWAGTSEDDFNAKLAAAGTESERANIVLQELAEQGLMGAAEGWRENNAEIVAANEATSGLEETTGRLGEMLSPLVTGLKDGLNNVLTTILDMVEEGNPLIAIVSGLAVALAGLGLGLLITQGGGMVGMLGKMATGFKTLNTIMAANPIILVVSLVAGLVAALITAYKTNEEFRNKVNAVWDALKTNVGAAIESVKGFVDGLKEKFFAFIDWLKGIPGQMKEIGKNLITGLWNGITDKVEWLKGKVSGVVDKIKGWFTGKDGFDTHSPSKWSEKVMSWVMQGMAVGVNKTKSVAISAVKTATDDVKEVFSDSAKDIQKSSEEIATAVENMRKKLSEYGSLTETVDTKDGRVFKLSDLQDDIDAIEKYGQALANVKAQGISDGLFAEITDMGIEDAMKYMDELLSMTDADLNKYISLYDQKQKAAEDVAKKFYGVGEQAAESLTEGMQVNGETIGEDVTTAISTAVVDASQTTATMEQIVSGMQEKEPVLTDYITALNEKLLSLAVSFQGDYINIGKMLMDGVAEGVENGESGLISSITKVLRAAVRAAREEMDINSPSGVYEEIGDYMGQGLDVGWVKRMKSVTKNIRKSMADIAKTPSLSVSGPGNGNVSKSYSFGDTHFHIGTVNNGNGRDTKILAQELEFDRRCRLEATGG